MFCDYIGKFSKWNSWGLYTVTLDAPVIVITLILPLFFINMILYLC